METLHRLTISARTSSEAYDKLNSSTQQLQAAARENPGRGILVTRYGPGRFVAELTDSVPYGETWESLPQLESDVGL